tara:strand:- start:1553 stop:2821 length:1269 start_codon:yes stop_codon:yes gene_type:complete
MIVDIGIWIMYFISIYFAVFWMLVLLERKIGDVTLKKSTGNIPIVTVAIPAYNEEKSVLGTLKSVIDLKYSRSKLQVIVVDDCSSDDTRKVVENFIACEKEYYQGVDLSYVRHSINKGKGVALNTALKRAKGDFFICLDADSFVESDALMKIMPQFENDSVASVLPLMKLKKHGGFALNLQFVEYLVNFFLKKIMGTLDCIHVTPGPFAVYRKKALDDVGGFDENNLTEDLEMALRLQKRNYKIIQLIGAKVYTLAPDDMKGWFKQRNRWYKGTLLNMFKYKEMLFNKKYGEFGMFQLPMVGVAAVLSIFFAFFVVWKHMMVPLLQKLYDLSYINFNVGLMTNVWYHRFNFLDMNYVMLFFLFVVLIFGLAWIVCAFKYTEESFSKRGVASAVMFMIIYPFFLSLVWLGVAFDLVRRKKQKW